MFVEAVKTLASKKDNLDNMESYLSNHFWVWIKKYANTPEKLVGELSQFAEMEI